MNADLVGPRKMNVATNSMKPRIRRMTPCLIALLAYTGAAPLWAQSSELDQLKAAMANMQKTMQEMQEKIARLEQEKEHAGATNAIAAASLSVKAIERIAAGGEIGEQSPVGDRSAMRDYQEGAPRPKDYTLDPKYRGFIPVPNTPVLVKFNAKPRVDATMDSRNAGNSDRFATATIPVEGESNYGGTTQFNMNARGSSLSLDVRAPELPGNFRFYYNNDFFGGGGGMSYRLKQLYGQFYDVTAGFTYSCFEDPDAWPDTVDYEGPNSVIFARRPVARYALSITEGWQMNFGLEAPAAEIDAGSTPNNVSGSNSAPDGTMNVRWENAKIGHVQLGSVVRSIGAKDSGYGNERTVGWGFNLSSSVNVFERDSVQAQLTYGEGIFRYFNDDFINNDAAFDAQGNLNAIPTFGAMIGYTHHWSDQFRSTATYGYVNLDNEPTQGPNAYHETHYASLNLVWQLRKKLSVGLEGLYGQKEAQSGATGDVFRVQLGMVYSLFD